MEYVVLLDYSDGEIIKSDYLNKKPSSQMKQRITKSSCGHWKRSTISDWIIVVG